LRRTLWEAAQQAASDEFEREIEFVFERRVSVPLSKMLIGRLRNRAQSTNISANELPIVGEKRPLASVYSQTYGIPSAGAVPRHMAM